MGPHPSKNRDRYIPREFHSCEPGSNISLHLPPHWQPPVYRQNPGSNNTAASFGLTELFLTGSIAAGSGNAPPSRSAASGPNSWPEFCVGDADVEVWQRAKSPPRARGCDRRFLAWATRTAPPRFSQYPLLSRAVELHSFQACSVDMVLSGQRAYRLHQKSCDLFSIESSKASLRAASALRHFISAMAFFFVYF